MSFHSLSINLFSYQIVTPRKLGSCNGDDRLGQKALRFLQPFTEHESVDEIEDDEEFSSDDSVEFPKSESVDHIA